MLLRIWHKTRQRAPMLVALLIAATASGSPTVQTVVKREVIDVNEVPPDQRMDLLADMHLAKPERVFMLSKALGVLP